MPAPVCGILNRTTNDPLALEFALDRTAWFKVNVTVLLGENPVPVRVSSVPTSPLDGVRASLGVLGVAIFAAGGASLGEDGCGAMAGVVDLAMLAGGTVEPAATGTATDAGGVATVGAP